MGLSSCCLYMVGLHTRLRRVSLGEALILLLALQDHIERKNIDLSQLKFHVLDEANEMLRMGFVEDARYKMLAKFRHFFSVLLCQIGLSITRCNSNNELQNEETNPLTVDGRRRSGYNVRAGPGEWSTAGGDTRRGSSAANRATGMLPATAYKRKDWAMLGGSAVTDVQGWTTRHWSGSSAPTVRCGCCQRWCMAANRGRRCSSRRS
ncbi:hypothetical protein S245_004339 [Arachis hypogaea]